MTAFDESTLRLYPTPEGVRLTDTDDPSMDLLLVEWADLWNLRDALSEMHPAPTFQAPSAAQVLR